MKRALTLVLASALGAAPFLPARAEQAPEVIASADEAQHQRATEDLYQSALQSISEGRKNDASSMLRQVIEREPKHAGAWLDLAMIQCALGHASEAERLFAEVETRFNPSPGMLEIIASARETGCQGWRGASTSAIMLARGLDRNVNQGASNPYYAIGANQQQLLPDFLPKRDQYTQLSGEWTRELSANGSIGFAQFQLRRNDHFTQYDNASLFVGVESPYRFGYWTMRTTAMLGLVTLGGSLYQRQVQLQTRLSPPLPLPETSQFSLLSGVTHTEYLQLSAFNSDTYEMRGLFTHRRGPLTASASLGAQHDHGDALRPGGSRNGVVFNLSARRRLDEQLNAEVNYTRQRWHSEAAYAPGVINEVRQQVSHMLRGVLSYQVRRNHVLQLEMRLVRNRENISLFQYNNRQLQLSWQWQQP